MNLKEKIKERTISVTTVSFNDEVKGEMEAISPDDAEDIAIEYADSKIKSIDWKLIEKEIKHLINNYGVPENDYRGYPDADDIVRTVKYIIEHKQQTDENQL